MEAVIASIGEILVVPQALLRRGTGEANAMLGMQASHLDVDLFIVLERAARWPFYGPKLPPELLVLDAAVCEQTFFEHVGVEHAAERRLSQAHRAQVEPTGTPTALATV